MNTELRWIPADAHVYRVPAACRFLTAESFLSIAMQAYLAASKDLLPPPGEPWIEEGVSWCNAESFNDWLLKNIYDRLRLVALGSGDLFEVTTCGGDHEISTRE